jgi:peptidoglycan/xylan/chitin deacetylase (PgdA/CDA1 family)
MTLLLRLSLFISVLFYGVTVKATVILQYHHISSDTPPSTSLTPELFSSHMQHLLDAGYTVVALPDLIQQLKNGDPSPLKSVVITFDDAYDSVYEQAFPILKAKRWPFTVFVNTQPLENKMQGFVTWAQLNEMAKHGATIANHSHTHTHFLRRQDNESQAQWRERIRQDVSTAEDLIERRTGQRHGLLAYPYGEYDLAVKAIVEELGLVAFGQQSGPVAKTGSAVLDFLALPRFPFGGIYGSEADFKTKVATVAMPVTKVSVLEQDRGSAVKDTILPAKVERPVLMLTLDRPLPATVQCFASGQGAIDTQVDGNRIRVQARQPLPVGRSRYNCTSASEESGRFYWYSHFFIRKQANGEWYSEP